MKEHHSIFFPGLNGIRAIAALAVVLSHITVYLGEFKLSPYIIGALPNGNPKGIDLSDFAVSIFFALSGFLITYLLLAEDRQREISIKNFYMRRILRIWPLYYVYYLAALIFIHAWKIPHENFTNFFYIFFSANVPKTLQIKSDLLGHYWSLGVEEQFYLFWPLMVKKMRKVLLPFTVIFIIFLLAVKLLVHFAFPDTILETATYLNRFSCILIGAVGSMLYFQKHEFFIKLSGHFITQLSAWVVLFLSAINQFHIAAILDQEIMCCFTVALIIGQIGSRHKIVNLNTNYFDFLGKISYGIYVIHPLIIFGFSKIIPMFTLLTPTLLNYILVYTGIIGLTILIAYLSYEYLEKPFLKMKGKFTRVESQGSRQMAT